MATIKTALVLQDRMSSVMRSMTKTLDSMIAGLESAEKAGSHAFDPNLTRQMRIAVGETNAGLSEMEDYIRKAGDQQQTLNNQMKTGGSIADGLVGKIKQIAAGYIGMKGVQKIVELSDEMAQIRARIDLMNDGFQTTGELMDSIYAAANRSRGGVQDMANLVAKLGNNARRAFNSSAEIVDFAEAIQKQFVVSGASATEASNAMIQLSQALASGVLRGDELRSVMEQAPGLIKLIAKESGIAEENIRDAASKGLITAEVVKNAVLNNAGEINEAFENIPMTWQGVATVLKNKAIEAAEPLLNVVNRLANMDSVQTTINTVVSSVQKLSIVLGVVADGASKVFSFMVNNWSKIAPVVYAVVGALAAYKAAQIASNVIEWISVSAKIANAAATGAKTVAIHGEEVATVKATMAQWGLNTALLASPVTWIVIGVVALIAALIAVCAHIAKTGKTAKTTLGVIMGGLNVAWAAIKNTLALIGNVALGIMGVIGALIYNAGAVIHNGIRQADSWLYGLLSSALKVVEGICEALNKLPFVKFDYSGISNKAAEYAEKSAAAAADKQDYVSISDNWRAGFSTFSAFEKGWAKDAYAAGAAWGDAKSNAITEKFNDLKDKFSALTGNSDAATGYGELSKISDDTSSIAKSLNASTEELSWIRELAEREVINRFTTAEVKIDMTGMTNEINSDVDVDGLYSRFTDDVHSALQTAAAGVN